MNTRSSNNGWVKVDFFGQNNEEILKERIHLVVGAIVAGVFFIAILLFIVLEILVMLQ